MNASQSKLAHKVGVTFALALKPLGGSLGSGGACGTTTRTLERNWCSEKAAHVRAQERSQRTFLAAPLQLLVSEAALRIWKHQPPPLLKVGAVVSSAGAASRHLQKTGCCILQELTLSKSSKKHTSRSCIEL